MSTILEADDRLTGDSSWKPVISPGRRRITWGFNLALFAFQSLLGLLNFVFLSGNTQGATLEGFLLSSSLDLVRVVVVVLLSAWFVRVFWTRLLSTLTPLRPIVYREAVAIVLMIGLLVGR